MADIRQVGRLGRLFVSEEDDYGVAATLLSTHFMRHLDFSSSYGPFNRVNSTEKKATPGLQWRFDRREDAKWDLKNAVLRPSGTAGVKPECATLLKACFGDETVGGSSVTYSLTNDIAKSLSFARYFSDFNEQTLGAVVQKFKLMFNNNEEAKFSASGPAQMKVRPAPTYPGVTLVGAQNPPSGLTGGLTIDGTAYNILTFDVEISNGLSVINEDFGTSRASGYVRDKRRDITFTMTARVTDNTYAYEFAEAGTDFPLVVTCGTTPGNIITVTAPRCEFVDIPDTPDGDGLLTWTFKGVMKEVDGGSGNDELTLAFS